MWGLYRDNGKGNGNYCLGFSVCVSGFCCYLKVLRFGTLGFRAYGLDFRAQGFGVSGFHVFRFSTLGFYR